MKILYTELPRKKGSIRLKVSTLLWCLLLLCQSLSAKTYYFSSSQGNDARTPEQATNPATPWRSITKLNSIFSILQPGDAVLLKRGDVFEGGIRVGKSGTTSAPITIGAYGIGDKPVVTGFVTISGWRSLGGGRYEAYHPDLGVKTNMVVVNNQVAEMGRYPNSNVENRGYLKFEAQTSNYIVDNELPASPSWQGAELVVRSQRYVLERRKITSHSGTKLTFDQMLSYEAPDNFGYFIQDHIRTLDRVGEWFHTPATKKITVFFGNETPANFKVQVSAIADVIDVHNYDNIIIDGLEVTGGNQRGIDLYSADNVVIRNCDLFFSGGNGISAAHANHTRVENNFLNHINNVSIFLILNCNHSIVKGNRLENTGMIPGLSQSGANKSLGIREVGTYNLIEENTINNTGLNAIFFSGNYTTIKNNVISNFNMVKDDGGAIYTVSRAGAVSTGRKIIGNIISGGLGAAAGTANNLALSTSGIYIDDYAANIDILDNTVTGCSKAGIFIHNAANLKIIGNTVYDCRLQLSLQHDVIATDRPLRNLTIKKNVLFAKLVSQVPMNITTLSNDIVHMGTMDSNYYCRPMDDHHVIRTSFLNGSGARVEQTLDIASWRQLYKKDLASKGASASVLTHRTKSLIGTSLPSNGDFNANISGVNAYANGMTFTKSWVSDKLDKGTFQGTFSGSRPGAYIVSFPAGAISANKNYVLRFNAMSSKDTMLHVFLRKANSPHTILSNNGQKNTIKLTRTAKQHELLIESKRDESDAVIFFEVLSTQNTFWIDQIRFSEADMIVTNPDDSMRLVTNPSPDTRTIALSGTFLNTTSQWVNNSITLKPFSSMVLIKKPGGVIEPLPNTAPVVNLTSPKLEASYEDASTVVMSANAVDADGSIAKVEFYKGDSLLGQKSAAPYTLAWNKVKPGRYKVKAKAIDNKGAVAFSTEVVFNVKRTAGDDESKEGTLEITKPEVGQVVNGVTHVDVQAMAKIKGNRIKRVDFFHNGRLLKTEYNAPYEWRWQNLDEGTYEITARATTANEKVIVSKPVRFTVKTGAEHNQAPTVAITSPVVNASFNGPADVRLTANARDEDGNIRNVQFFVNDRLVCTERINPYAFTWNDVPAGNYRFVAVATDNKGKKTTSAPVTFTVRRSNNDLSSISASSNAAGMAMLPEGDQVNAAEATVNLYPNPAVNRLFVGLGKYQGTNARAVLSIRNMAGAVVKQVQVVLGGNTIEVDVASLSPGIYILGINGKDIRIEKRFMKQHK